MAKAALTDLKHTAEVLEHERSQCSNEVAKVVEEVEVSTLSLTISLLLFLLWVVSLSITFPLRPNSPTTFKNDQV